jgi:stage IV sporulation protein FB
MNLALLLIAHRYPLWADVNFSLLCYNLLPILPLDGGRILTALFARWFPEKTVGVLRGMCAATGCAFFFSVLLRLRDELALGCGFWLIVIMFLWNLSVLLWQEKRLLFLR